MSSMSLKASRWQSGPRKAFAQTAARFRARGERFFDHLPVAEEERLRVNTQRPSPTPDLLTHPLATWPGHLRI